MGKRKTDDILSPFGDFVDEELTRSFPGFEPSRYAKALVVRRLPEFDDTFRSQIEEKVRPQYRENPPYWQSFDVQDGRLVFASPAGLEPSRSTGGFDTRTEETAFLSAMENLLRTRFLLDATIAEFVLDEFILERDIEARRSGGKIAQELLGRSRLQEALDGTRNRARQLRESLRPGHFPNLKEPNALEVYEYLLETDESRSFTISIPGWYYHVETESEFRQRAEDAFKSRLSAYLDGQQPRGLIPKDEESRRLNLVPGTSIRRRLDARENGHVSGSRTGDYVDYWIYRQVLGMKSADIAVQCGKMHWRGKRHTDIDVGIRIFSRIIGLPLRSLPRGRPRRDPRARRRR